MNGIEEILNLIATPAFEEDITDQVRNAVDNTFGRAGAGGATGGATSRQERETADDPGKTDDIFGLNEPGGNDDTGSDTGDTPADDANADGGDDQQTDDQENPDDTGTDDNPDDESDDSILDEDNSNTGVDLKDIYKKNKLRDNMILFYNILVNNIDLVSDALGNLNDARSIEVCNAILENLRSAKEFLFDEIENGLSKHPYEEILRRYISLRRVYDVSIEMLDKHFGNINSLRSSKKGKKKK